MLISVKPRFNTKLILYDDKNLKKSQNSFQPPLKLSEVSQI